MANTKKYLSHLLQNTGITPACSEEERTAAETIAKVFENHGFTPEVQEFSASGSAKVVQAGLGIVLFVGSVLMGIGGAVGIVGLVLALAAAVLFVMERTGRPVLSQMGSGGLSQNVIAYHKASGPLASPRNRPVVVVAHYDSPRVDLLNQEPYAAYRPILVKLLPIAMVAPAVIAVIRLFPLPDAAKIVLWILAIVCALVPLANAVAIIANRFVLPYTTGAVCNMSSVAAMLGVMDAVSPYELGEEFPHDQPADEYFADQQRIYEEALAAAQAAAAAETAYPHELDENGEVVEGEEGTLGEEPSDDAEAEELMATGMMEVLDGAALTGVDLDAADELSELAADDASDDEAAGDEQQDEAEGDEAVDLGSTAFIDGDAVVASLEESDTVDTAEPDDAEAEAVAEQVDEPADYQQDALDFEAAESADIADGNAEPEAPFKVNAEGNVRFGAAAIQALGMLPASCSFVYEEEEQEEDIEPTAFEVEHEPVVVDYDEPYPVEAEPADTEDADSDSQYDDASEFEAPEFEVSEDEAEASEDSSFDNADEWDDLSSMVEVEVEQDAVVVEDQTAEPEPEQPELFDAPASESELSTAVAMPALNVQPTDTVDALMAEINRPAAAPQNRTLNIPSTADAPVPRTPASANRASLFDLPDPSSQPLDPFAAPVAESAPMVSEERAAEARSAFTVISSDAPAAGNEEVLERIETISAPAPTPEKPRRGLARLFGRKKKNDDSMSEWLGVDDGFDAKRDGADIGSWDNFDDDGWKGGATGFDGASEEELCEAIADMGDDELLGHDIWFVATGASENGNAGIRAFLDAHRDKLRGVFLINLECVGAGQVSVLSTEGEQRVLKGDKRIMKLVQRVSADFHHPFEAVDMPQVTTDAHVAMGMSLRSLTIGGVDGTGFALSHTEQDQPYNVDLDNISVVSDVVTEVIRRS